MSKSSFWFSGFPLYLQQYNETFTVHYIEIYIMLRNNEALVYLVIVLVSCSKELYLEVMGYYFSVLQRPFGTDLGLITAEDDLDKKLTEAEAYFKLFTEQVKVRIQCVKS